MSPQAYIGTSDPRATEVGARVLAGGGNCVDAALAASLALWVLEPHYAGIGGDGFLLVQMPGMGRPEGLDGSGAVPAGLTPEALAADGLEQVPILGPKSITVPGGLSLLEEAATRYGTQPLGRLAAPATEFAEQGFEARESLATACTQNLEALAADPVLGPLYAPGGAPLEVGDRVVNPALGKLLRLVAEQGSSVLYRGSVAAAIAETVRERGGYLSEDDLAAHATVPMAPVSTSFHGRTVWQLPQPTQGPAVLAALDYLAAKDAYDWPTVVEATIHGLFTVGLRLVSSTTYVACIDGDGGGASLITSVFAGFGSGVGVDVLGSPLQNRGAGFILTGEPPRPGKPPHTLIPGLVTRGGELEYVLGVVGGLMQAQGQIQLLLQLLVHGLDPQAAIDAPRFRVLHGGRLALEPGHPLAAGDPEAVGRDPGAGGFGSAQVAARLDGRVVGGSDSRRGGQGQLVEL